MTTKLSGRDPGRITVRNHMLCWKPYTSDVWLCRWPDRDNRSFGYRTTLACMTAVHGWSFLQRKCFVFIEAMHLIVRDQCDPQAVHRALLNLAEYQDGCSDDMPGMAEVIE